MSDARPDVPSVLILTPGAPGGRGRGRPRVADPGTGLSTWMPSREYDRIVRIAQARGQSVSSLARESLVRDLLKMTRRG